MIDFLKNVFVASQTRHEALRKYALKNSSFTIQIANVFEELHIAITTCQAIPTTGQQLL